MAKKSLLQTISMAMQLDVSRWLQAQTFDAEWEESERGTRAGEEDLSERSMASVRNTSL